MFLKLTVSNENCQCGALGMVKDFMVDKVYCCNCWGEYLHSRFPDYIKKVGVEK